jgi:protoporphyrinogen oxidase
MYCPDFSLSTIFEKDSDIGGLAGTFELEPGRRVEKFYHHWFTSDTAIIDFAKELGFGDKLKYVATNTGLYFANSIFRLASPKDLLSFTPIPFFDRIRTGLMSCMLEKFQAGKGLRTLLPKIG